MSGPEPDLDSAFYWAALREHRIALQQCDSCSRRRFPPMPGCPYCGATGHEVVVVGGGGQLYSWVRVHRALTAAVTGDLPYNVGVVELEAGPRMIARIEGEPCIGAAATPTFEDHDEWTELRYRVVP
jgi:uncharacterized OB-fold protein